MPIISPSTGRGPIQINKGVHMEIEINRYELPTKLPIIFLLVDEEDNEYCCGVNAYDLFQESTKFKRESSIARETSKIFSPSSQEVGILSYKIRVNRLSK